VNSAASGIRANAVAPGFVEMPIRSTPPDSVLQHLRGQVPIHRPWLASR
jgi:NAD(P)-dependent dehydrogenase (short-subunit alcohol dehydrogenase family)